MKTTGIVMAAVVLLGVLSADAQQRPTVMILPVVVERVDNPARGTVLCPLCKGVFKGGIVQPGSENTLTRLLYDKIEGAGVFTVLLLENVKSALSRFDQSRFQEEPVSSAALLGNELNAAFVLLGYLFRFEERIGSSIGVEKPASVGFDLHLVRVREKKVVWTGRFDETQRPLTEDLRKIGSFFKRGAVWLTAEELASSGLSETLKKMPPVSELEK
jgi:hypothetical protein